MSTHKYAMKYIMGNDGDPRLSVSGRALKEATYKDIKYYFNDGFLAQKMRASLLKRVMIRGVDDSIGAIVFDVDSDSGYTYENIVKMVEWDDVVDDSSMSPIERARLLMFSGNLQLHCDCPSFLYWGFQYLLTTLDNAALYPETIPPNVRNPRQKGIVCKHLRRTLEAWPFHSGDLAKHIGARHPVDDEEDATYDMGSKIADAVRDDDTDSLGADEDDVK